MSRILGTETEYGIAVPGQPAANPVLTSSQVVTAYAQMRTGDHPPRWDYEEEHPLRDARGFDLGRDTADAGLLTDEETTLANVVLTNGARLYVDHAHPEYSAPETTNPLEAVIYDKAGEHVMLAGALAAERTGCGRINLYKNNVDNKGASYGAHENYMMSRDTPFADIVTFLIPFLVSRQVICGAGRVGIGQQAQQAGFQISQRADYFEVPVGLETTMKRPIVNTRDEPHADPERWRRLHLIIGDANLSETSILLKLGTAALVLDMLESGWLSRDWIEKWTLAHPVSALRAISHDPSCTRTVELADGRQVTAIDIQTEYAGLAAGFVAEQQPGPVTEQVLDTWQAVLSGLTGDPMQLADRLDWVAKYALLRSYADRDGLGWDSPKLALIDLQYADIRPEKSLFAKLVAGGRMRRLVTDEQVAHAVTEPPVDTRAYFRGTCMRRYPRQIAAASWDSVVFDVPGIDALQRIPTMDPARGTAAHTADLFDRCDDAAALVAELTGT